MRNLAPSLPHQSRSAGIDAAIGQIDLIGEFGEIVKSWRIRSPRCTIGSGLDCSVQLTTPGIASLHTVLIFGKKHTLLRSVGPTLISNRHVREWLIDQPTEISVGQSRLVIHPSIGVLATVVHAENLIDHAARMCKDPTPLNRELPSTKVAGLNVQPNETEIGLNGTHIDSAASARLDDIEKLLESLQISLDNMQASLGTDANRANESIVESVTQEIDEFGKKLFTSLNEQLANQTGVQQSLISHLADRFTDRLGAIDEQLNRFSEATNQHTSSLNELLTQASREQTLIEDRFHEVISHRNELIDAVQVLRSEIALAYLAPGDHYRSSNGSSVAESAPDKTNVGEFAAGSPEYRYDEYSQGSVSDDQLAQSLERAQIQIQELNAQLRNLEAERDSSQQRVAHLIESWPLEESSVQEPSVPESSVQEPSVPESFESDPGSENQYGSQIESDGAVNHEVISDEIQYPAATNEVTSSVNIQLQTWFKQDVPEVTNADFESNPSYPEDQSVLLESESNFASFSAPDLTCYSDVGCECVPLEQLAPLDQPVESSNSNSDSISARLQRMLIDADHRRGASNPPSELRTSGSWSQRYSNQPTEGFENSQPNPASRSGSEPESVVTFETSKHAEESDDAIDSEDDAAHNVIADENTIESKDSTPNAAASSQEHEPEEEESIEEYMQRLLHRVRGGSEDTQKTELKSNPTTPSPIIPTKPKSRIAASLGLDSPESDPSSPDDNPSQELFVPRKQAPEQRNDLVALRELANTNARRAITRSDIRRTNSAFFLKLGVTALAVSSAAALFMFNGLTLNAPFAGMVAAVVVALLWGYDCANHFKRLKNVGERGKVTPEETAAGQSIRVSSSEDSGWRPTSD